MESKEHRRTSESPPVNWKEFWSVIRPVSIVLTFLVWLLVTLPQSIELAEDLKSSLIHIPIIGIALSVIGASIFANEMDHYSRLILFLIIPNLIALTVYEHNSL